MWNNEGYLSKQTSQTCTDEHLWGPTSALFTAIWVNLLFTAAVTVWQYLAHNKKNRPIKVLALYMVHTKMSYWQQVRHREYSKPFGAFQTWGGYGHCLWDPNLWQKNIRRFCWWVKALKKCLSRWGLLHSVQYSLCHSEPMKASDPVKKKKIWADTMYSDPFYNCHLKKIVHPPQNGEQCPFLQSGWEPAVKPPTAQSDTVTENL